MFKKVKNYFADKKEKMELLYVALLTLINDSSDFYRVNTKMLEQQLTINETINPNELKLFMENINKFIENPQLSDDFYKQISKFAHKEHSEV